MNNRTSFVLLAFLTAVGTLTMSSAYAENDKSDIPQTCVGCSIEDARELAAMLLLKDSPVSVWTDKTDYNHSDIITVTGAVANLGSGLPVTVTVVSPLSSIITVDQLTISDDKSFETRLNTAGAMWKYDGTYTIKVDYGSGQANAKVELTGGVDWIPNYATPPQTEKECGANELTASGYCIPYNISGGKIIEASIDTDSKSVIINIDAEDDGILVFTPSKRIQDGIFFVLVDGQEWDDVTIDGNKVTVMFPAGTEVIEIVGTFVIPEFGTIAAMILAVAIISIIAISARSRLSIIPRY